METTFSDEEVRLAAPMFRECVINNLRLEPVTSALLPILIRGMRSLSLSAKIFGDDVKESWQSLEGATLKISGLLSVEDEEAKLQNDLDSGTVSKGLQREFKNKGISLSQNATILIKVTGNRWLITDKNKTYTVRKEEDKLKIELMVNQQVGDIVPATPNEEKLIPILLEFSSSYQKDNYQVELIFHFKKEYPRLYIDNWKKILTESFGAIMKEFTILTSGTLECGSKERGGEFESTAQIMNVIEQIRDNIKSAFPEREHIQIPITIYEPRCRAMFYYTTKGLATHIEDMERVDDFFKFFIDRCVEDTDYYDFMEEAVKREDNPEVVKTFKEMIRTFKEYRDDWKDKVAKQRQKIEGLIEDLRPYMPQEPFAGITYSNLKNDKIILWDKDIPYDPPSDDQTVFFPLWSGVYAFERLSVGRVDDGKRKIQSGMVCPIYLFPGQWLGAVFAVPDESESNEFNSFNESDYFKLYALALRESSSIRKALQNDFYQSVLKLITGETELSEIIFENIDKALKIAGATLWRFEDGEPKLTKTRRYYIAARYNSKSYFVRLVSYEDDKWECSSIIESIKEVQSRGESKKQEREIDYSTWDVVKVEKLKDDKSYYDDLNRDLKKNRDGKDSDKIDLQSALIIVRFAEDIDAQYHPKVAYVLYFEETDDVIRTSAAEMVAVVDYAFNFSDIQKQAADIATLEETARTSVNFLHGMKNAFDNYCSNAEILANYLTDLSAIRTTALRLRRQLLFRRSNIAWGYIAANGFGGRHVIKQRLNLLDILQKAYIYSVAEFFNPDSLEAAKGRLGDLKQYKKQGRCIPPVLCDFKEPQKLIRIDVTSQDWEEGWIIPLSEVFEWLKPQYNVAAQWQSSIQRQLNLRYLPYGDALIAAFAELFINAMFHGAFTDIDNIKVKFIRIEISKEGANKFVVRIANRVNDLDKVEKLIANPLADSQGLRTNRSFFWHVTRGNSCGRFDIKPDWDSGLVVAEVILDVEYWTNLHKEYFEGERL